MFELLDKLGVFLGSIDCYEEADSVIIGLPMDFTVSFRPGTRSGPQQIRNVSVAIEEYSVYQDRDLADYSYFDGGDVSLQFGQVKGSLDRMYTVCKQIHADNKMPIMLGGEHLVSLPLIQAASEKYPDMVVLHFDAHADLREDYLGEPNSHATVIRKVCDFVGGKNVYQFGIRSGTKEEFEFAKINTNTYVDKVIEPLKEVVATLGDRPVYVTIDIDVVDPAFAPGTGTPEPGGCTSKEILEAIHLIAGKNVIGFDLVEVSPAYDVSERTALLGAKIVREAILAFTKPKLK